MFKKTILILIVALFAATGICQEQYIIRHIQGDIIPDNNLTAYVRNNVITDIDAIEGNYYRLIQFNSIPSIEQHALLESSGITLLEYLPHRAYVASIPLDFDPTHFENFDIRHISALPLHWKLSENVLSLPYPEWAFDHQKLRVSISYFKDIDQTTVLDACGFDGIIVTSKNGHNNIIEALIDPADATRLASLPYIRYIELVLPPDVKDDIPGRAMHRSHLLDTQIPGGRNIDGKGVGVLCRDDGEIGPHIDFQGRLNQDFVGPDRGTHGDGVSGIMAGAGNVNPRNRGMAAGADLFVIDYQANFLDETMDLHLNFDVLVTNSSYSNGCNNGYTNSTITVDQQMFNNPTLLHVFSAGNSNNMDCDYGAGDQWGNITGGHKQGKNVIATANLDRYTVLESSSSRGPAHDGRIKPDISAHGQNQISTAPNNGYLTFGGTSGAAPGIAGVAAQLHQAYRELNGGQIAEASLIKPLLLNSANDLGTKGPDFRFGWGHVNAYRALQIMENNQYIKEIIEPGETKQFTIDVPNNLNEVKVMLYWPDQEASNGVSRALINNLDLTMTDGQDTFLPWKLNHQPDPALLALPAGVGIDSLNNMEQVAIDNPAAGTYTVNVTGKEIPFGSHSFYLVWEFREDTLQWIYPSGGEKMGFLDTEVFHWETASNGDPFQIEISIDGGNNWLFLDNAEPDIRLLERGVPQVNTDSAQMRITRSGESFESNYFTITQVPRVLSVDQICPDSILFNWENIDGAISYDVHMLGEKYMEYLTTVDSSEAYISVTDPRDENWLAVSANFDGDVKGRRSLAIPTASNELIDCDQLLDLRFLSIVEPTSKNSLQCTNPYLGNVVVEVLNNGTDTIPAIDLSFTINGMNPVVETYSIPLAPDSILIYTFTTQYEITQSGDYTIDITTDVVGEQASFDNALSSEVSFYLEDGEIDMSEDFSNVAPYPAFWYVENDDDISWTVTRVRQKDNETGNVLVMPFGSYTGSSQLDAMSIIPLDLTAAAANTYLSIDMAYFYTEVSDDLFRIIASTDCGLTYPDTIYSLQGRELATSSDLIFAPNNGSHWRTRLIPLSDYVGMNHVVLKMETINDNGNNLYLDNFNITTANLTPPSSNFSFAPEINCALDTLTFFNTSTGTDLEYRWEFGLGSNPAFSYEENPGQVMYLVSGPKEVKLLSFNGIGRDTMIQIINIYGKPTGDFTFNHFSGGFVYFFSEVVDGMSYQWDFGDGNTSDKENPVHTYLTSGSYTVKLVVTNDCLSATFTNTVDIDVSSVGDVNHDFNLNVYPNPTKGMVMLQLGASHSNSELAIEARSMDGRLILERSMFTDQQGMIQLDFNGHPQGLLLLTVKSERGKVNKKVLLLPAN